MLYVGPFVILCAIFRTFSLLLLKSTCFIGFLIHICFNFYGYFCKPDRWVNIADAPLGSLKEFPFVLQAIIHDGFDDKAVKNEGYENSEGYFLGMSKFNKSVIGWRGQTVVQKNWEK